MGFVFDGWNLPIALSPRTLMSVTILFMKSPLGLWYQIKTLLAKLIIL